MRQRLLKDTPINWLQQVGGVAYPSGDADAMSGHCSKVVAPGPRERRWLAMKIDLTRCVASPSAAATFGTVADVRLRTGDVIGSPAWSPPE